MKSKLLLKSNDVASTLLLVIFFMATGNFSERLVPASVGFLNQSVIVSVALIFFIGFSTRFFKLKSKVKVNYLCATYVFFILYVLISVMWSKSEGSVYARATAFIITTLLSVLIAGMFHYSVFAAKLFKVQLIFICLGVFLVVVAPSVGVDSADHEGAWVGVFNQKNTFGRSVSLCATLILVLYFAVRSGAELNKVIATYVFCCFVLLFSSSRTSLVMTLIIPMFVFYLASASMIKSSKALIYLFLFFVLLLVLYFFYSDDVYLGNVSSANDYISFFGVEVLLTGRATIWAFVLNSIEYHDTFWTGFGYDGFWGHEESVMYKWGLGDFVANDSHNGFLDIYLQTGFFGLFLFFLVLLLIFVRATTLLSSKNKGSVSFGRFLLIMVVFICLFNLTESSLLKSTNVMQFIFSFLVFSTMFEHNVGEYDKVGSK